MRTGDDAYRGGQVVQSGGRASADAMSRGGDLLGAGRSSRAEGAASGHVLHHTTSHQIPQGRNHLASWMPNAR